MSLVTMFSSGTFRGVITNTPSGTSYNIIPNQAIAVDSNDVALLTTYGLTAFPASSSSPTVPAILTVGSGDYTVPAGVTALNLVLSGGGAGGGGVAAAAARAAGGGAGVLLHARLGVTPGQIIPYVVGAKGLGAAAGNNPGNDGNDTTFGILTAGRGLGGAGSASGNAPQPNGVTQYNYRFRGFTAPFFNSPTSFLIIQQLTFLAGGVAGSDVTGTHGGVGTGSLGLPGADSINQTGNNATTGYGAGGGGAGSSGTTAFGGGNGLDGVIFIY